MVKEQSSVLVSIVTRNDEAFLEDCLESLEKQSIPVRVRILDNASMDGTLQVARRFDVKCHRSPKNLGFAKGHNTNLLEGNFEFALVLNADTVLEPDFIELLVKTGQELDRVGMVGGKLLRLERAKPPTGPPRIDSAGIYFTPSLRHFDRGSNEPDRGQYQKRQFVFGITGAAVLLNRRMLEDIRWQDEYFDQEFFAYREDADLSWRAQLLGWRAVFQPEAVGWHVRQVIPSNRRTIDPMINYHSVKNRFLMRCKNMDWAVKLRCFPYMWIRDLGILTYILSRERSSLGALRAAWKLRPRMREKRRDLFERRNTSPREISRWFSFKPVSSDI